MSHMLPPNGKPNLSAKELDEILRPHKVDRTRYPLVVVGLRGFFREMGSPGVNDRGIYDDALVLYSPTVLAAFNGNTDPNSHRKGQGTGAKKGMASLNPGACFVHMFDLHKGKYLALCQRLGPVTVTRDGDPSYEDTGNFGINIHKGGYKGTSSEGCQTIHPDQWQSFINLAVDQAKRYHGAGGNKVAIPYILKSGA